MLGSNERQIYAFSLRRLMVNTQIHVFEHRPVLTKKIEQGEEFKVEKHELSGLIC